MEELMIDPEFKSLIPPLTDEERDGLEKQLLVDGCRDAIVVWNRIIVDGHNRYAICQEHGIPFSITEKRFGSRAEAKLWILEHQLSRRNLTPGQRALLVDELESIYRQLAKDNQLSGLKQYRPNIDTQHDPQGTVCLNSGKRKIDASKELAKVAGVGKDTITKVKAVKNSGNQNLIDQMRRGEISANKAYNEVKGPKQPKPSKPEPSFSAQESELRGDIHFIAEELKQLSKDDESFLADDKGREFLEIALWDAIKSLGEVIGKISPGQQPAGPECDLTVYSDNRDELLKIIALIKPAPLAQGRSGGNFNFSKN